ncbi:MarR family transcriptional regulator [Curtobacterium flaccumfaciens]|nr:MarR family transcriptional regulator [Curtobacterium flaccumfaciens]
MSTCTSTPGSPVALGEGRRRRAPPAAARRGAAAGTGPFGERSHQERVPRRAVHAPGAPRRSADGPQDLAVMLNVSNASVTKIVDGLVAKGDFVRAPHPTDRRAQVLEPTAQAEKKIDASYARFHEAVVEVMDHLSNEDNDVLARCLAQITEALAEGRPVPVDEYTVAPAGAVEPDDS